MSSVACLIVLAAAPVSTPQTPFCRDYETVLSQAYRGWRDYRGVIEADENESDDKTYRATLMLPGATCKIHETELNYQYNCSWPQADSADWQGTVGQARTLARALAACSQLPMVDAGETHIGNSIRWRGFLGFSYASGVKVEVTASNFATSSRHLPSRMSSIYLTIAYQRHAQP